MKKKLALFVAWALLAAGVVMGSSTPASAIEGVPFPFERFGAGRWSGYATGTSAHLDLIQTDPVPPDPGSRVVDLDVGFSGAVTDTDGLEEPIVNEFHVVVKSGDPPVPPDVDHTPFELREKEAYGRGSGLELGLGEDIPTDDRAAVLSGRAEAASFPPERSDLAHIPGNEGEVDPATGETPIEGTDTGIVRETTDVPGEPLLFARALEGMARANFDEQFCITNTGPFPLVPLQPGGELSPNKLAYGRGKAALVQLVERGARADDPATPEDESTIEFDAPVAAVGAPTFQGAADTHSFTYLIPAPVPFIPGTDRHQQDPRTGAIVIPTDPRWPVLSDPNDPDTTYALVSEVRGTTAPISVGPPPTEDNPLTPLDERDYPPLTVHVVGDYMMRVIVSGRGEPIMQVRIPGLLQFHQPPNMITGAPNISTVPNPLVPPLGDPEPHVIGDPATPAEPTFTNTSASAAIDGVRLTLPIIPGGHLLELRLGHMEVSAQVPVGGINCPGRLRIDKNTPPEGAGVPFSFDVVCNDPDTPDTFGPQRFDDVIVTPTLNAAGDAATGSATVGPIPSGMDCEVTEDPPPGWVTTSPNPQTASRIVTNQTSSLTFFNVPGGPPCDPAVQECASLVIEKRVPTDDLELQDITYRFDINCVDAAGNPMSADPFERAIRPADGPEREDDHATADVQEFDPAFGDTRDPRDEPDDTNVGHIDGPLVNPPVGGQCTVTERPGAPFAAFADDLDPATPNVRTDSITVPIHLGENIVRFRNERVPGSGLVLTKDAPDDAQNVEFDFSVNCPAFFAQPVDVRITGDGSSGFIGIPPGTECTVHEFNEPGFVSQPDVTVIILPEPSVTEVTFVNIRGEDGSLFVTKDAPDDAQNVIFTFVISCPSLFNEPFARSVVGDGRTEPVVGIPAGTVCTVTEPTVDGFVPQPNQQILVASGANNVTFVNTRGQPVVGGVTFQRPSTPPAVAANAQPRFTS